MTQSETETEESVPAEVAADILMWAHSTHTSDDVAKLLRLHALTEFYLDRALALRLHSAGLITQDARFTYYHKRVLAKSLSVLPDSVLESLKRLSSLRNKCAHSPLPKITPAEILHAAQPIQDSYDNAISDNLKDGQKVSELSAYSWALFTEMTLRITPLEMLCIPIE